MTSMLNRLRFVVNGIVDLDRPPCNTDFASVRTSFNDNGVVSQTDNTANNASGCHNLIADLQVTTHLLYFFFFFLLWTNQEKIEHNDHQCNWQKID